MKRYKPQITKAIIVVLVIFCLVNLSDVAESWFGLEMTLTEGGRIVPFHDIPDDQLTIQQLVDRKVSSIWRARWESNSDIYKRLMYLTLLMIIILIIQFFNLTDPKKS